METSFSNKDSFVKSVTILEKYLHTVILPGAVVVHRNSFLIQSSDSGVAIGFHELPRSQKRLASKDYMSPRVNGL